jgi:aspartate/methionine/tyrosine aminotransferase
VLVPNPSYPIHIYGAIIAGADIRSVRMTPGVDFFAELERAIRELTPKPKMLILGFPSNPTAQCVDLAFFEKIVALAKQNDILVVHDLAYADIVYDDYKAPSIMQVPGAREVAVEFFTVMVKALHDIGWMVEMPRASMYIWAKIPEAYAGLGSIEFTKRLLEGARIAVAPGVGFGDYGDDHVRIALIENEHRLRQAARGIRDMFRKDGLLRGAA